MRTYAAIGVVVVVVLAAGAWVFLHAPARTSSSQSAAVSLSGDTLPAPGFAAPADATSTPEQSVHSSAPRTAPAGYSEYRSAQYNISLFYPNDLKVSSYNEGGGASTITFQDAATAQGFQIFVLPYTAAQIGEQRFKEDEPSGVMDQPLNVTVDGTPATSFYSTNQLLGDTAEIWMLKGGYLYEITTLKPLAGWLGQIMQSWEFI